MHMNARLKAPSRALPRVRVEIIAQYSDPFHPPLPPPPPNIFSHFLSIIATAEVVDGSLLSTTYYDQGSPIVSMRIAQAGVRLAALLNYLFP